MGIIVDAGGLSSEISTATGNLAEAKVAIEQCKQEINAFCSDFSLSGSSYSSARQYFSSYLPMLDALSSQIENITSGAATVSGVLGECPDLGYGDSDQIKRDIQQAERMKQYYEQKKDNAYYSWFDFLTFSFVRERDWATVNYCDSQIAIQNEKIKQLNTVLEELNKVDGCKALSTVSTDGAALARCIRMGGIFPNKITSPLGYSILDRFNALKNMSVIMRSFSQGDNSQLIEIDQKLSVLEVLQQVHQQSWSEKTEKALNSLLRMFSANAEPYSTPQEKQFFELLWQENYEHNCEIGIPAGTIINDQNTGAETGINKYRYGLYEMGKNGCGVIATANALILMGKEVAVADVAHSYEVNNGIVMIPGVTASYGAFGTNPYSVGAILDLYEQPYTVVNKAQDMNRDGGVYIVSAWNNSEKVSEGMHFFAVELKDGQYTAYNYSGNGKPTPISENSFWLEMQDQFVIGYALNTESN